MEYFFFKTIYSHLCVICFVTERSEVRCIKYARIQVFSKKPVFSHILCSGYEEINHFVTIFSFISALSEKHWPLRKKLKFSIKGSVKFPADLVTLTEEMFNRNLHF